MAGLPALGPSARRSSHTDARGSGSFSLAFDAGVAAASRSKSVHVILKQKVKVARAAPEYASPGSVNPAHSPVRHGNHGHVHGFVALAIFRCQGLKRRGSFLFEALQERPRFVQAPRVAYASDVYTPWQRLCSLLPVVWAVAAHTNVLRLPLRPRHVCVLPPSRSTAACPDKLVPHAAYLLCPGRSLYVQILLFFSVASQWPRAQGRRRLQ